MAKKDQEILLLYLHALNQVKFQHYHRDKEYRENIGKSKELTIFLEKSKIKNVNDFSVDFISHRFNGLQMVVKMNFYCYLKNVHKVHVLQKFPWRYIRWSTLKCFTVVWNCSVSTLLSSRVNLLHRWSSVEESIRYLDLLQKIHKIEIMHQLSFVLWVLSLSENA